MNEALVMEQTGYAEPVTDDAGAVAEKSLTTVNSAPVVASPFDRLIAAATDPKTDPVKMGQLLDVAERWRAMEAKQAYAAAFAAMQADLPIIAEKGAIRHDANKPPQSTYAKWEDINEALRAPLSAHGFALSFRTEFDEQAVLVTGKLMHEQGHAEETTIRLPRDTSGSKNAVQAVGSSLSYGKRYAANALLNLASRLEEDDDGAAAGLGAVVDDEQLAQIVTLIRETGTDEAAFAEYFKVDSVSRLRAADFDRARAALNSKKAQA